MSKSRESKLTKLSKDNVERISFFDEPIEQATLNDVELKTEEKTVLLSEAESSSINRPAPISGNSYATTGLVARRSVSSYILAQDDERFDTPTGVAIRHVEGKIVAEVEMRNGSGLPDHSEIRRVASKLGGVDEDVLDICIANATRNGASADGLFHIDVDGIVAALEKRTSPFSGTTTFSYDPAGNLTSTTDGNSATTTTTYDVLNRPLVATSTRSGKTTETVTAAYDDTTSGHFGIGRLKSMTDPTGSTTYTYERHGNVASQVQIANGTTFTTTTTYDGNANRKTVTLLSTRVLTYTYDYADRPSAVASSTTTYVSSATYKPFGPLTQLVFGNGTTQTKSYNQRYLLTENKLVHGSTSLSDVTFTENGTGYITKATDTLNAAYDQTFQYGGRATNMLTNAQSGSSLWGTANYADTYNQNLSSITFPSNNYGLTYSRAGLLTSLYNNDTGTSQAVTYDGAGNELTVGTSSYMYSSRNHLNSGDGVTYTYDGVGRRVSATATAGTRTSLYDPEMHLQTETGLTSGAIAYDYIWLAGVPVAQEDVGGSTHWTETDYRNTPFMQTTSAGAVYWQADYAPFGAVYALRTSDVHQPLRMPGQEAEEFATGNANGLTPRFYNGYRWYRPLLARYTQADPLGYDSDQFNLYGYSLNNAINYSDPLGLVPPEPGVYGGWHTIPQAGNIPDVGHEFYAIVSSDGSVTTVSGEPIGGRLNSVPGRDLNGDRTIINPSGLIPITPPTGVTDSQLGQDLIAAGNYYQTNNNNLYDYFPVPVPLTPTYNSNSFYSTIGQDLNLTLPSHGNIWFPGDANILPGTPFGPNPGGGSPFSPGSGGSSPFSPGPGGGGLFSPGPGGGSPFSPGPGGGGC